MSKIYVINPKQIENFAATIFDFEDEAETEIVRTMRQHIFAGNCPIIEVGEIGRAVLDDGEKVENYKLAKADGLMPVYFDGAHLLSDALSVRDWASELHLHSPRIYAAILKRKVSFAAMIEHARKWHADKARRAENLRDRGIERDDVGAPTVLDLDGEFTGWRWVWLKSDEARDEESRVMGHCVGDGSYDHQEPVEGVFSLRDARNQPHVTVELNGTDLEQAQCRGNTPPPDRFTSAIEAVRAGVGLRLAMAGDPVTAIPDGVHRANAAEYHVVDSRLHRECGPALICEYQGEYFEHGVPQMTRFVINRLTEEEWYDADGLVHRDGGPARTAYTHHPVAEKPEWWRHGERVEEDGTPWVEPRHFEKGHVYLKDDAPQIVVVGHTAKTPDDAYSLPMDGRLERNGKILREFGCTEYEFDSLTGASAFTLDTFTASYSFKNDGHGGISLSVVKSGPIQSYTFAMPERIPWRVDRGLQSEVPMPEFQEAADGILTIAPEHQEDGVLFQLMHPVTGLPALNVSVVSTTGDHDVEYIVDHRTGVVAINRIKPRGEPADFVIRWACDRIDADADPLRSILPTLRDREAYLDAEGFRPKLDRWPYLAKRWEDWKAAS